MVEAVQTTASPAATWAIVIVAVVALAVWLGGIFVADHMQARASGRSRMATWPSYTDAWTGGSVAGEQAQEIPEQAVHEPIGTQGQPTGDERTTQGETPTRADVPAMPRQRSGEGDRPEHSHTGRGYAGQSTPDEEDPDR